MPMDRFWHTVSDSAFPWEEEALDFLRRRLPEDERVHAWSNFEFLTRDGRIYEVDLLVVTPAGLSLVEIKSWPGHVAGDAGTWTWTHDGRTRTYDNPRVLANRKAKILKSLLLAQRALRHTRDLYIDALVFLSHDDVRVDLDERARIGVYRRDRDGADGRRPRPGIVGALTRYERPRIDRPKAAAIARAMDEIGIRASRRSRRFGDHQLRELLHESDDYQEWRVEKESFAGLERRARLYPVALADGPESRERRVRAARREFSFLRDLRHPGILWPVEYLEDERGPVLFFDHHGDAQRLDHFLRQEHERLTVDQRLALLRQLFEAVDFAHDHGLVHRALSPRAVEVERAGTAVPQLRVGDWYQGRRRTTGSRLTATDHVGARLDEPERLYLAPETWTQENIAPHDEPKLDVFSLGAIAYHVFAGTPPAADLFELNKLLQEGPGLQLSSVVDGAVDSLQDTIACATHPDVAQRLGSVAELLGFLDIVEDELTEPDASAFADPRTARSGDVLPGGYKVRKVLGSGSTARVFQVAYERAPRDLDSAVLKVAHEPEHNARLDDEYDVLEKLRHHCVVAPYERVDVGGRTGIVMEQAGETTLERRLRDYGRLDVDELRRLGDELLRVVDHLEEKGIAHRDLKPANLGLRSAGGERSHLVVFDFSLSRAPADKIRAGTVGYLDRFLSQRGQWDVHAERFAAAVILYEMATAAKPVWGDGRSDPALVDDAAPRVYAEQFPHLDAAAEALAAFFRRALAPTLEQRFDTCEEMIEAWGQVFVKAQPAGDAAAPSETPSPAKPEERRRIPRSWNEAGLDDELGVVELSTRARGALERAGARRVRDVPGLDLAALEEQRNVGQKTRFELAKLLDTLRRRFPDIAPSPSDTAEPEAPADSDAWSIDQLFDGLVARSRRPDSRQQEVVKRLLGLPADDADDSAAAPAAWPSQTDVADALGVTRARVGQVVAKARSRWLKRTPALTALRTQLAAVLEQHGGVMTVGELAEAMLFRRGSTRRGNERRRRAVAVVRAAVEAETARDQPRYAAYRRPQGVFLAATGEGELGPRLATFASQLGQRADELADADPLPGPGRVLEALRAVTPPQEGGEPWSPERLLHLAAAASRHAALSSRRELYPRGLSAERAVHLAQGSLMGAREIGVDGVHRRVYGRFPEAASLPRRPELDDLLREAGTGLVWWPDSNAGDDDGHYGPETLPTLSSDTAHGTGDDASAAEAARFESRLERAVRDHRFLVLTVAPKLAERAADVLAERFDVTHRSLERLLVDHMRRVAEREGADWDVVLEADAAAPSSDDWGLLLDLVRHHALPDVENDLQSVHGTLLLTRPGLLARYDALAFFERLREHTGSAFGAWVLVPTGDPTARPTLDGHALPVVGPGDWMAVPEAWLEHAEA